jgi:hypothetical protein
LIRNYSLKRVIVKEGKQATAADTPSGEATPTQEASVGHLDDSQSVKEKPKRSPNDLENGLSGGEDGVDDEKVKN